MRLSELNPDIELEGLLAGKISVKTSATDFREVPVYSIDEMPNIGLADEVIRIRTNGNAKPQSKSPDGFGLWGGTLMVEILCKSNADSTIKRRRNDSLISQVEEIVGMGVSSEHFFFYLSSSNPVTPPTPNLTTGYYTTLLNVQWRNL